ncbi:XRE family transcriptional regulator, partial [Streptococcus pneumoniae]|nr:XRE family transcriptional regulator [Streptococcus pneumoniae]
LMPDFSALPSAYLELKYQILREPIYDKEEEYDKKEACLEEIEDLFYEQLPNEEKVWFEATRATIDVIRSGQPEYGETVLDDYFKTIYDKELFLINELEVINLYFAIVLTKIKQGQNQIEEINRIHSFLVRLTNHVELIAPEYLFALSNTLFSGLACLDNLSSYDSLGAYIFSLNHIMEKTQDFQKKPIILMLEWKLSLIINNDYVSAEQFYQKSKLFADIIENSYLVTMLEKQWQEDVKKYL